MTSIFYAHAKHHSNADIDAAVEQLRTATGATVVAGRDDFSENFARCGGWDAWCRDVAAGIRYHDRKPRYDAIICPDRIIGKATATIVEVALERGKPVLYWQPGEEARVVWDVETSENEDSWKAGWYLVFADPS